MKTPKEYEVKEDDEVHKFEDLDLSRSYSYADYLTWRFEEMVEIIKGHVFPMSPAPGRMHQEISLGLTLALGNFFGSESCKLYVAPFDVRFPNLNAKSNKDILTVVQPDLCVICDRSKLDEKGCVGPPDLVVEILSQSNSAKDLKLKYKLYEEFGVKEYWIVYPHEESVHVFVLQNEKYSHHGIFTREDILVSPLFPELAVNFATVFGSLS